MQLLKKDMGKLYHDHLLCMKIISGRALEHFVVTHISQKYRDITHLHLEAWAHLAMYAVNAYRVPSVDLQATPSDYIVLSPP